MHDVLNPDHDIDDSQSEDGAFEEIVGDQRPQLGIEIQDVVVLPDPQPWKTQEENADEEKINDVEGVLQPGEDAYGPFERAIRIQTCRLK